MSTGSGPGLRSRSPVPVSGPGLRSWSTGYKWKTCVLFKIRVDVLRTEEREQVWVSPAGTLVSLREDYLNLVPYNRFDVVPEPSVQTHVIGLQFV